MKPRVVVACVVPDRDTTAEARALPLQAAQGAALLVVGAAALLVDVLRADTTTDLVADRAAGTFVAVFRGLLMWLALRRRSRTLWDTTPLVAVGPTRSDGDAVRRAAPDLAVGTVALTGALAVVAWLSGGAQGVVVGAPFGGAIWVALATRDLALCQGRTGTELCTRRGARRFAWTSEQARDRMVRAAAPAARAR